jgi:high frequency lysogenization protein
VETAGQINPRILVRGNAEAFKDINHTNYSSELLFTGLQMAHLWRQLGGSSWSMILANVNYYKIFKLSLVYSIRWFNRC